VCCTGVLADPGDDREDDFEPNVLNVGCGNSALATAWTVLNQTTRTNISSVIDNPAVGTNVMNQAAMTKVFLKPEAPVLAPRSPGAGTVGLYRSSRAIAEADPLPDMMIAVVRVAATPIGGGFFGSVYAAVVQQNRYKNRGYVKLLSNLYIRKPEVSFNLYAAPYASDVNLMVEAAKNVRAAVAAIGGVNITPSSTVVPAVNATDAQILSWINSVVYANWHTHGGASMASVVDSHFRVIGAKDLRVCDNSVCTLQHPAHAAAMTALQIGAFCGETLVRDNRFV